MNIQKLCPFYLLLSFLLLTKAFFISFIYIHMSPFLFLPFLSIYSLSFFSPYIPVEVDKCQVYCVIVSILSSYCFIFAFFFTPPFFALNQNGMVHYLSEVMTGCNIWTHWKLGWKSSSDDIQSAVDDFFDQWNPSTFNTDGRSVLTTRETVEK